MGGEALSSLGWLGGRLGTDTVAGAGQPSASSLSSGVSRSLGRVIVRVHLELRADLGSVPALISLLLVDGEVTTDLEKSSLVPFTLPCIRYRLCQPEHSSCSRGDVASFLEARLGGVLDHCEVSAGPDSSTWRRLKQPKRERRR